MDRQELAGFLRSRRERLRPADAGLRAGAGRRRTPGLRREEVARLAGISVDYYARLEQARGPRPSAQVLEALARALRLAVAERDHLFRLADQAPGPPRRPPREVPAGILHLLDRLDDTPALVLDAKYEVLAWNAMAVALITDFAALPQERRNAVWGYLREADGQGPLARKDRRELLRGAVADLRAAAARYPDDPGIADLVERLMDDSAEFAALWATHDVAVVHSATKRITHPLVGELELDYEVLLIPERDQRLLLYTAAPGTPSHDKLQLLRIAGGAGSPREAGPAASSAAASRG